MISKSFTVLHMESISSGFPKTTNGGMITLSSHAAKTRTLHSQNRIRKIALGY